MITMEDETITINKKKEKEKTNMENLAQMLKDTPVTQEVKPEGTSELSVNEQPASLPVVDVTPIQQTQNEVVIPLINMYTWFLKNSNHIPNVILTCPLLSETQRAQFNYDPRKNLTLFVKRNDVTDGKHNLDLVIWKKPEQYTMVDLEPQNVSVFEEGMEVSYRVNEQVSIFTYTVKTGLYIFTCVNSNGLQIPFDMQKVKKGSGDFRIPELPGINIDSKLAENCSIDSLVILYPPFKKETDVVTNFDAVKLLQSKREKTVDNNHLMQINKTISAIIFGR